jgi:transcriptional regulator with XRE-family HTH domain
MDNYGLIIQHLRTLAGLSVQQTAKKIGKSVGWLSEIENNSGRCRLTENEFNRIIELLDGTKHRAMFKTWIAGFKNRERLDKVFDGAVLKFVRLKKELSLSKASKLTSLSAAQLSKFENGLKPVSLELRNQIMAAYGYSPTSFKNFSTDPVRSKVVPIEFKLTILLNSLEDEQIEQVFRYAHSFLPSAGETEIHSSNQGGHHGNR